MLQYSEACSMFVQPGQQQWRRTSTPRPLPSASLRTSLMIYSINLVFTPTVRFGSGQRTPIIHTIHTLMEAGANAWEQQHTDKKSLRCARLIAQCRVSPQSNEKMKIANRAYEYTPHTQQKGNDPDLEWSGCGNF